MSPKELQEKIQELRETLQTAQTVAQAILAHVANGDLHGFDEDTYYAAGQGDEPESDIHDLLEQLDVEMCDPISTLGSIRDICRVYTE